jgi:hypothetical protein
MESIASVHTVEYPQKGPYPEYPKIFFRLTICSCGAEDRSIDARREFSEQEMRKVLGDADTERPQLHLTR